MTLRSVARSELLHEFIPVNDTMPIFNIIPAPENLNLTRSLLKSIDSNLDFKISRADVLSFNKLSLEEKESRILGLDAQRSFGPQYTAFLHDIIHAAITSCSVMNVHYFQALGKILMVLRCVMDEPDSVKIVTNLFLSFNCESLQMLKNFSSKLCVSPGMRNTLPFMESLLTEMQENWLYNLFGEKYLNCIFWNKSSDTLTELSILWSVLANKTHPPVVKLFSLALTIAENLLQNVGAGSQYNVLQTGVLLNSLDVGFCINIVRDNRYYQICDYLASNWPINANRDSFIIEMLQQPPFSADVSFDISDEISLPSCAFPNCENMVEQLCLGHKMHFCADPIHIRGHEQCDKLTLD